jgi:hypothetical protein
MSTVEEKTGLQPQSPQALNVDLIPGTEVMSAASSHDTVRATDKNIMCVFLGQAVPLVLIPYVDVYL